ncbi:unnamed protein product [Symbiodinium sp. CCMP2456]|nr:unnamed protein product [Symbiodinium sp. CCMP2456]
MPTPGDSDDQAIYGDGGYSKLSGATFACQARSFGRLGQYWDSSAWVSAQLARKLPPRLGWESTSLSMVCALCFRRADQWHLLVFDRSALFSSMRARMDGLRAHPFLRVFSRLAFVADGVVGVDIRNHQSSSSLPFPVLTQGNEAQDAGCGKYMGGAGRMAFCPHLPIVRICAWHSEDIEAELAAGIGQEAHLQADVNGSSATACSRESGSDLAYRGAFPKAMGAAIYQLSPPELEAMANQELEQFATLRQSRALQSELCILSQSRRRALPAIQFAQRLMLGLRCVRSAYQARLSAWLHLASIALADPAPPGEEVESPPDLRILIHPPTRDLQRWLASPQGTALVREIRWALLLYEVVVRRL